MGYSSESFYAGGPSTFEPDNYASIGFKLSSNGMGFPGSTQTANQLKETINAIKQGVNVFEISMVSPEVADQIPTQHFKEIRALTKLTGIKPSVHGPIIDPAGMGQQGWGGEDERKRAEDRFKSVVDKAHMIDPSSNIPIVFHATNSSGGTTYEAGDVNKGQDRWKLKAKTIINPETKQMTLVENHRQHRLGESEKEMSEGGQMMTAEEARLSLNRTQWDDKINEVLMAKRYSDEKLNELQSKQADLLGEDFAKLQFKDKEEAMHYQQIIHPLAEKASSFVSHANLKFSGIFDTAFKFAEGEQKTELKKISEEYGKKEHNLYEERKNNEIDDVSFLARKSSLMEEGLLKINQLTQRFGPPEQFKDADKFIMGQSAKTFGNTAYHGFKKYGDNAPVLAIENVFPEMNHARGEDMRNLVKSAHKVFVENAMKDGISEEEANKQADKLIGVTWDVGHLNIYKKYGFDDKDLKKQTEIIAPHVKHLHLTDNFGYGDSHLAPGMGNVPIKAHLEALEKAGRLGEIKKIIEAPAVVQHFGTSPMVGTLAAFGSPIYGAGSSANWGQAQGMMGNYFSGYGFSNPSLHHSMYGAGFTNLPMEFGGNIPGTQSRFSGTPNA